MNARIVLRMAKINEPKAAVPEWYQHEATKLFKTVLFPISDLFLAKYHLKNGYLDGHLLIKSRKIVKQSYLATIAVNTGSSTRGESNERRK